MIWHLFDYLFGWTKRKIEKEERNAKLMEIRQNVAAKCIQRAYRGYKIHREEYVIIIVIKYK